MSNAGSVVERISSFRASPGVPTVAGRGEEPIHTTTPPLGGDIEQAPGAQDHDLAGSFSSAVRIALFMLAAVTLGLVLNLVLGSRIEHRVAQSEAFNRLRSELALGTAPGPLHNGSVGKIPVGTPMALLEIPSLGVKEVVGEGTTSGVLMAGPGHVRSTPFPGGAGTSEIFGRAAAYGGPFARIDQLRKGARITVTTQVGTATFSVIDHRKAGDVIPRLAPGRARLTLATATGPAFVPSGVVWVDADLVSSVSSLGRTKGPLAAQTPAVHGVPASERPLGVDTGTLWLLALWLAVLALVVAAAMWTWRRRGHAQAWITFTAPIAVVSYFVAGQIALLLPNLM